MKIKKKSRKISDRQWQKTLWRLIEMLADDMVKTGNPLAEKILEGIQPDGHKMAGYCRFVRRGPLALLPVTIKR